MTNYQIYMRNAIRRLNDRQLVDLWAEACTVVEMPRWERMMLRDDLKRRDFLKRV